MCVCVSVVFDGGGLGPQKKTVSLKIDGTSLFPF